MPTQIISWIEEILWPQGERRDVWMILDGARDRRVYSSLLSSYLEYSCLYAGDLDPALEVAAPHLAQLESGDRYTHRILESSWGNSWGVFLKCDTSLKHLRRHLRHFLIARDARSNNLVFRFYDPRVLRTYLPTCNSEELRTLFGPIEFFWTEGPNPGEILEFGLERGKLASRARSIEHRGAGAAPAASSGYWSEPSSGRGQLRYTTPWPIREAQMRAFSHVEVQKFEEWMVVHLKKFFPGQVQSAGETQLRENIQYGIRRAASYGITSRRDVCKYLDLATVFGRDFDTDRRSAWAGPILRRPDAPEVRMRSLLQVARQRLGRS